MTHTAFEARRIVVKAFSDMCITLGTLAKHEPDAAQEIVMELSTAFGRYFPEVVEEVSNKLLRVDR